MTELASVNGMIYKNLLYQEKLLSFSSELASIIGTPDMLKKLKALVEKYAAEMQAVENANVDPVDDEDRVGYKAEDV